MFHNAFVKRAVQNDKKLQKMVQEGFVKFLPLKEVLFWISHGSIEYHPADTIIFYQQHYPLGLHIFTKGAISVESEKSRRNQPIVLKEPAILALNHVMDSTVNKYTVRALEQSEIIFIPRAMIQKRMFLKETAKLKVTR